MFKNRQLLQDEEEFVRLNTELDRKTRDLMEQVDLVMKQHGNGDQEDHLNPKWEYQKIAEAKTSLDMSESEIEATYNRLFKSDAPDKEITTTVDPLPRIAADDSRKSDEDAGIGSDEANDSVVTSLVESLKSDDARGGRAKTAKPSNSGGAVNIVFPGKLTRHKSEIRLRDGNGNKSVDGVVPESLKGMGQENIIRFLKAKVKVLTEQLDIMHGEEKKHIEKIKELQVDRERVAEDRDKWIQQANIAKNVLVKHEQHASNIVVQLQNIQAENGHLKREVDKLKKELKQVSQTSGSNEVRLNRSIEEVEKLKASLRQAKQDEKDLRESHRRRTEELSSAVKRLDKQRIELLHAFKKQLVIIDNLKKQKGLIEAGKFVKNVEDDFMEFLDWNPGPTT